MTETRTPDLLAQVAHVQREARAAATRERSQHLAVLARAIIADQPRATLSPRLGVPDDVARTPPTAGELATALRVLGRGTDAVRAVRYSVARLLELSTPKYCPRAAAEAHRALGERFQRAVTEARQRFAVARDHLERVEGEWEVATRNSETHVARCQPSGTWGAEYAKRLQQVLDFGILLDLPRREEGDSYTGAFVEVDVTGPEYLAKQEQEKRRLEAGKKEANLHQDSVRSSGYRHVRKTLDETGGGAA